MTAHDNTPKPPNPKSLPKAQRGVQFSAYREAGKAAHRTLTDAVKLFGDYVDSTGARSESGPNAYRNYTRIIYAAFGFNKKAVEALEEGFSFRDTLRPVELEFLARAEIAVADTLLEGMRLGALRDAIKEAVRTKCQKIAAVMRDMIEALNPTDFSRSQQAPKPKARKGKKEATA